MVDSVTLIYRDPYHPLYQETVLVGNYWLIIKFNDFNLSLKYKSYWEFPIN